MCARVSNREPPQGTQQPRDSGVQEGLLWTRPVLAWDNTSEAYQALIPKVMWQALTHSPSLLQFPGSQCLTIFVPNCRVFPGKIVIC